MKVGVITFHHAKQSYGACLQAYATLKLIEKMGCKVELINYENASEQSPFKDFGAPLNDKVITRLNWFVRMYFFDGYKAPYNNTDHLDGLYETVTKRMYRNVQDMDDLTYDVLVSGSDQIWNPDITGGVDPAFLLQFGKAERRVSYASSMGSHVLSHDEAMIFEKAFKSFSAISVREDHARQQLQPFTPKPISVVMDPTLLLDQKEWQVLLNMEPEKHDPPYMLTYFIGGNVDSYWKSIEKYANALRLPIYNIQSHKLKSRHVDKALYAMTLQEMLQAIQNATVVVTDSFHGAAFSINFGKQLITIPNRGNPLRVSNLLSSLGLESRILPSSLNAVTPIDYNRVHEALGIARKQSIDWLNAAIIK